MPVGKVYTSQFNRAYETAVLAGFKDIEKTANLSEGGLVVTPDENNRRAKFYTLTATGRRRLRDVTAGWNRLAAAMTAALNTTSEEI